MGVFDPDRHDNKLNITDINELNEREALGIIRAEDYILDLDVDFVFDSKLILDIHTIAFGELYEWAGKWRTEGTNIGIDKERIPYAMAEYAEQVNILRILYNYTMISYIASIIHITGSRKYILLIMETAEQQDYLQTSLPK